MVSGPCACPKCGRDSQSVAAMNYRETREWSRQGALAGSGVGVGSGGLGLGVGGGRYSETGEIATKRAGAFVEPELAGRPSAVAFFVVGGVLTLLAALGTLTLFTTGGTSMSELAQSANSGLRFMVMLSAGAGVLFALGGGILLITHDPDRERARLDEHRRRTSKYNAMRYCENCHAVFDERGNIQSATAEGFETLLAA